MELIITTQKELKSIIQEVIQDQQRQISKPETQEEFISKKEASKLLQVSTATIDNYRRNGILPSYRIGANVRFKRSEVISSLTNNVQDGKH